MHNRKALRANAGLWPWEGVSRRDCSNPPTPMPLLAHKGSLGKATVFRSAHTKYPIKKGFKFPPLSWAKINLNSIYSARIPTEQVIAHNRSARWQQLKGETLIQSGICFQRPSWAQASAVEKQVECSLCSHQTKAYIKLHKSSIVGRSTADKEILQSAAGMILPRWPVMKLQ